jgi:hypothetical protein
MPESRHSGESQNPGVTASCPVIPPKVDTLLTVISREIRFQGAVGLEKF